MVNINKLLKQAQKMQEDIAKQMEGLEVEGSAGGGAVKITMNGKKEILSVAIGKDAIDPDDLHLLEDLVKAAANDAVARVDDELSGTLGGAMPPGFPVA
ncbi:MAG: YbaB/EbfC family nucleoid-associated protein [Acidobacteria bacterium]|nr:YbaB/EbfC family nucleoid-associated protein [Acidobacteriota bacterium]